jgi:ABC-2 type transport system ATP-binding protein
MKALVRREWVEKHALKGVSFDVAAGEMVGLVGANGAGKTTLVKALAGIIHPTSGEADVLGFTPWHRRNDYRRQIALIMGQKAQLWWDLPAADCFLLLREIYRIPPSAYREQLEYLTDALEVRDQLHIQIRRLSLGERMKMELIAALLHRPKVVFLDEPTIGLDLSAQRAIREFLRKYQKSAEAALLVTSHYMEDIERLCERILILREGEFVYDGPLTTLMADFARHKVVTARLSQVDPDAPALARDLGEVIEASAGLLRVKVDRERVPEAASSILQRLSVIDLNIEEVDIGTVIEAIQRGQA